MTEKEFVKKMKIALAEAGINQSELAEKMGIKKQAVSNWFAGYRKPKVETLQKIASATGKPLNYFFDASTSLGDNAVVGNNNSGNNCAGVSVSQLQLLQKENEIIKKESTPIYNLSEMPFSTLPLMAALPAGDPAFFDGEKIRDYVFPVEFIDGAKYLILCNGDSMSPTLEKGDLLFIRPMEIPLSDKIMVVETEDGYTIKRVKKIKGEYSLIADNPNHKCTSKCKGIKGLVVKYLRSAI